MCASNYDSIRYDGELREYDGYYGNKNQAPMDY